MNPFETLSGASKKLFEVIQTQGPLTKNDLVKVSKMKLTSLNRAIKPLVEMKLVDEVGSAQSSGGRKPIQYDVSIHHYFLIGIDVSRTYFQVVLTDLKATVVGKKHMAMSNEMSPDLVVDHLEKMILGLLLESQIQHEQVVGVGLGTVGPMDIELGRMLNPKKFPSTGWEDLDIVDWLTRRFKLPVRMENGANTAIYLEQKYGIGRDCNSLAYFNCGIGIRTSVMNTNQVIRNQMNYEDTFAHMVVNMAGEKCGCGKVGCIEAYATIGSIEQRYQSEVKRGKPTTIASEVMDITYSDIAKAADEQEPLALRILEEAAVVFATGLCNFVSILSPEVVILSGPLIQSSDFFYDKIVSLTQRQHALTQKSETMYHKQGHFKQDAIAIGAAMMVTRQ